jgi:hypothetical protein
MVSRPDARNRLVFADSEQAVNDLYLLADAPPGTNALAKVASAKLTATASFRTPPVPDGVIAHPSAPQLASRHAVI